MPRALAAHLDVTSACHFICRASSFHLEPACQTATSATSRGRGVCSMRSEGDSTAQVGSESLLASKRCRVGAANLSPSEARR